MDMGDFGSSPEPNAVDHSRDIGALPSLYEIIEFLEPSISIFDFLTIYDFLKNRGNLVEHQYTIRFDGVDDYVEYSGVSVSRNGGFSIKTNVSVNSADCFLFSAFDKQDRFVLGGSITDSTPPSINVVANSFGGIKSYAGPKVPLDSWWDVSCTVSSDELSIEVGQNEERFSNVDLPLEDIYRFRIGGRLMRDYFQGQMKSFEISGLQGRKKVVDLEVSEQEKIYDRIQDADIVGVYPVRVRSLALSYVELLDRLRRI